MLTLKNKYKEMDPESELRCFGTRVSSPSCNNVSSLRNGTETRTRAQYDREKGKMSFYMSMRKDLDTGKFSLWLDLMEQTICRTLGKTLVGSVIYKTRNSGKEPSKV
jgi:hypothetical protein